jgi:hypothetical protein
MAGRGGTIVRDLTFDPHIRVLALNVVSYLSDQLANFPQPPEVGRSLREDQSKLA